MKILLQQLPLFCLKMFSAWYGEYTKRDISKFPATTVLGSTLMLLWISQHGHWLFYGCVQRRDVGVCLRILIYCETIRNSLTPHTWGAPAHKHWLQQSKSQKQSSIPCVWVRFFFYHRLLGFTANLSIGVGIQFIFYFLEVILDKRTFSFISPQCCRATVSLSWSFCMSFSELVSLRLFYLFKFIATLLMIIH